MKLLAIDPGNVKSAWVEYETGAPGRVLDFGLQENDVILNAISGRGFDVDLLAIEMPKPRGMPTSYEEMLTCVEIGRFLDRWGRNGVTKHRLVHRIEEKLTICGRSNATDSNIRQALIDRWGGKERAIGKKDRPGPLYGISNDVWQALAIAVTYAIREGLETMEGPVHATT